MQTNTKVVDPILESYESDSKVLSHSRLMYGIQEMLGGLLWSVFVAFVLNALSPEGFWYDQDQHEWVVVLQGAARLSVEGEAKELKPGDYINIPAHQKHRVEWTTPDEPTVWLAVFYGEEKS